MPPTDATEHLFPDLGSETAHLAYARRARDSMIASLDAVDPDSTADAVTKEYVEMTVGDALADLRSPGAGDFFGRIDEGTDRWYIGRRHIEDQAHDPVVVDWRAPIAAPFYRATSVDSLGIDFRRRFTLDDGEIIAYLDEHLDDPDSGEIAGGIPDPVLAEIGAARSGEMREIVATIQGEQDVIIRAPLEQVLIVQGGPGTGKTAVALHRAAYLLFEHRRLLTRDGVLVIGPNRAFLDYVANVLPSLGERSVTQTTINALCIPRVDVTGEDRVDEARWKGSAQRLTELADHARASIAPPDRDIVVPIGARRHVIGRDLFADWLETALEGTTPLNERRERVRAMARRELLRRTGSETAWSYAEPLKSAINRAWPTQKPVRVVDRFLPGLSGRRRRWTFADQLLVDEANSLLNGTPFTYGHVIVDEAQDHSDVALRVIARRTPSRSMTLVGDVAQSTTPAGQERWDDVVERLGGVRQMKRQVANLTIGYRVPRPILDVANRLLPLTEVDAAESRSVRVAGYPPRWVFADVEGLAETAAQTVVDVRARHLLTGIVAPAAAHAPLTDALGVRGLSVVDHVHELAPDEVPLFDAEQVKGLEFDGVVVVRPTEILHEGGDSTTARGARLLYVAMTRAVQELVFVSDAAAPTVISERG